MVRPVIHEGSNRKVVRYGFWETGILGPKDINLMGSTTSYDLVVKNNVLGAIKLKQPGLHNVHNSLAAISVANELI